jgi:hypothetical protein
MQTDPVLEWQRLTEEYREKGDGELLELARDFTDLTETARQVLRAEMQSRGMGDPANPETLVAARRSADSLERETPASSGDDADAADTRNPNVGSHDYTWKTVLRECETSGQAWQLVQALRQAGLDGWVEGSGGRSLDYPQVLVAADQLDQARMIAAKPIPKEIVDDSNAEVPEYVVPKCPKCGAEDPILEEVEPSNTWRCEQCDAEWTESLPITDGESPKG